MEPLQEEQFRRAKRRVDRLKGFYIHFTIYCIVNIFILVNIYLETSRDSETFWQWEHFFVLFAWGIGLGFHAARVFGVNLFLGENWERRQIEKYMEEDRRDADKFK